MNNLREKAMKVCDEGQRKLFGEGPTTHDECELCEGIESALASAKREGRRESWLAASSLMRDAWEWNDGEMSMAEYLKARAAQESK